MIVFAIITSVIIAAMITFGISLTVYNEIQAYLRKKCELEQMRKRHVQPQ
jgi:hypothetical protein